MSNEKDKLIEKLKERVTDLTAVANSFIDLACQSPAPEPAERAMPSPMYYEALALVHKSGKASVSMVQRIFAISYSDAENLIDLMVSRGDVNYSMTSGLRPKPGQLVAAPVAQEVTQQAAKADPIGVVGTMPGTDGFTMACFKASEVPVGTELYLAPTTSTVIASGALAAADDARNQALTEVADMVEKCDKRASLRGIATAIRLMRTSTDTHGGAA